MYESIYIPVDNSAWALRGVEIGVAIARHSGARVTASHVYAARLHDRRFRQMEGGLPERYLKEDKLVEQREVHDDLITRGLRLISDSYLDVASGTCERAGVPFARVMLEGKNWQKLVEDINVSVHDLVVMGALGLGAVKASMLGSVCERVARRIDRDLLVVKSARADQAGAIVAAIDGSPHSFGALSAALELARIFAKPVEAIAVYDPFFHHTAFHGIASVLSPAAAGVFRFEEQERLHEDIINSGLAKIYQGHLDVAAKVAAENGVRLRTALLTGKAFDQILKHARERRPWLLAAGRIGVHADGAVDLGSTAENLLRFADCHVLLAARSFEPPLHQVAETNIAWTREAEARMQRVPGFARGAARRAVVRHALERGHTVVTSDVIDSCLGAMTASHAPDGGRDPAARDAGAKCPFAHLTGKGKRGARREAKAAASPDGGSEGAARNDQSAGGLRRQPRRKHGKEAGDR